MFRVTSHTVCKVVKLSLIVGLSYFISFNYSNRVSAAEPMSCQYWLAPDKPRQTADELLGNLPLNQRVSIQLNGALYQIPVGYLMGTSWPDEENVGNKTLDADGINIFKSVPFSFWMPSGDIIDVYFTSDSRKACKYGLPVPGGKYVVMVDLNPYGLRAGEKLITPEMNYKNSIQFMIDDLVETNIGDLIAFRDKNWPEDFPSLYRNRYKSDPQAFIRCGRNDAPSPSCQANIYYPQDNLYFQVTFPESVRADWKEMANIARNLLQKWRVKNTTANDKIK